MTGGQTRKRTGFLPNQSGLCAPRVGGSAPPAVPRQDSNLRDRFRKQQFASWSPAIRWTGPSTSRKISTGRWRVRSPKIWPVAMIS
jgi:hypothetical protein